MRQEHHGVAGIGAVGRAGASDLYPFIIMLADTRSQASINAASVQHELRNNDLILKDYGHLNTSGLTTPVRANAGERRRLAGDELRAGQRRAHPVALRGQKIAASSTGSTDPPSSSRRRRGPGLGSHQENRDKSDRWMRGNVLPSIDEANGRMVIIGNWLHTDGLMARLKNTGIFAVLEFPLLRDGPGTRLSAALEGQIPHTGGHRPQA